MSLLQPNCRNIALTGFMAAGKTVVGRQLARKLRWRFIDLDRVVETNQGLSVEAIFSTQGEARFRVAEREGLEQVLEHGRQVIALGGGTVVDPWNLSLLKANAVLIWLRVSTASVLSRTGPDDNRPLLRGHDKLKRIELLAAQRESIYAQADMAVETDDKPVDRVVDEILRWLEKRSAHPQ